MDISYRLTVEGRPLDIKVTIDGVQPIPGEPININITVSDPE